jgi:hypothetical protein
MNNLGAYEIRIEGLVSEHWSGWFEGLAIRQSSDEETILSGNLSDQAALLGVLNKLHGLNLMILAVFCLPVHRNLEATVWDQDISQN